MLDTAEKLSLALLALGGAAIVLWAVTTWRRSRYTFPQACLYLVNTLVTRMLWRCQTTGRLPSDPGQGAIIVSNHRAGIDPLLIQLTTDRVVHWMVAREYMEHPSMAWAFRILRSIPVNRRGIDTAATKQAIRLASEGGLVGVFPEGRVNTTPRLMLPGRPGAALIALKARVPVIPCYITGSPYNGTALGSFLMTARTHVVVGEPIDTRPYYEQGTEKEVQEALTRHLMREIAKLAKADDFEPQLAGKHWKTHATSKAAKRRASTSD